MTESILGAYSQWLRTSSTLRWKGHVTHVVGNLVESAGPFCSVGESCEIEDAGGNRFPGEVVGFRGSTVLSMPLDKPQGIRFGDHIVTWGARPSLRVGPGLLGRVIDARGNPLDSLGDYRATRTVPIDGAVPLPLSRVPITEPLACGIRAVDGFSGLWSRSARRDFRRQRRWQNHFSRHDDARHRGRLNRTCVSRRTWTRGGRFS